jgi:hypothetical protein
MDSGKGGEHRFALDQGRAESNAERLYTHPEYAPPLFHDAFASHRLPTARRSI